MDIARLSDPFASTAISWRVGSTKRDGTAGIALAYIDARDVMERLDAVCGPANWQNRYSHADKRIVCEIGIKIGGEWVWKANGAGETDIEGEKGALSDSFKRAAVQWGIGRYLYDLPSPWVDCEPMTDRDGNPIKDNRGKVRVKRMKPSEQGKLIEVHEEHARSMVRSDGTPPVVSPMKAVPPAQSRDDVATIIMVTNEINQADSFEELSALRKKYAAAYRAADEDGKRDISAAIASRDAMLKAQGVPA